MLRRDRFDAALAVAIALLLGGCCAHRFARPAGPLAEGPALVAGLAQATKRVTSLEYRTRVSYFGDKKARKGDVDVLARRPARLRFEALTPTDDTLAVLASDGERFSSHERGQEVCYVGRACPSNISRLLPLAFRGADVVEVLAGGVPLIAFDAAESAWDDCEGTYRLTLSRQADAVRQVVWMRPDTFAPLKTRVTRGDELLFEIEHDDVHEEDGIPIPHRIKLKSPVRDTDLEIRVREAWLNGVTDDRPFTPACPEGTREEPLPCREDGAP